MINIIKHIDDKFINPDIPKYLYHYTSLHSFFKIIVSKQLLLFNSFFFNDFMENNLILTRLNEYILEHSFPFDNKTVDEFYTVMNQHLDSITPYVFCLTELPNSLSQWRAYGDDGYGVCIEIDTAKLNIRYPLPSTNANSEMSTSLHDIIYNTDEQLAIIDSMFKFATKQSELNNDVSARSFAIYLSSLISRFKSIFKAKEFSEESEWRIIYTPYIFSKKGDLIFTQDMRRDIGFIYSRDIIKGEKEYLVQQ